MRPTTARALALSLLLGTTPALAQKTRRGATSKRPPSSSAGKPSAAPKAPAPPASEAASEAAPVAPPAPPAPATALPKPALTTPTPAWAGLTAVLAVPEGPGLAEAASQVESELLRALASSPEVAMVALHPIFQASSPVPSKKGDELYEEGRSLYEGLDPHGAAQSFRSALVYYLGHPAEASSARIARIYLYLGASLLLERKPAEAREALRQALIADPQLKPDPLLFNKEVQRALAAERSAMAKEAPGRLSVQSVPTGAQVVVRGQPVGATPLELELVPGDHAVALTRPGYLPFSASQKVAPGEQATLRAALEPTPGLAAVMEAAAKVLFSPEPGTGQSPPEVNAIATRLGARYVVLVAVRKEGRPRLQAWDVQSKSHLRGVELEPGQPRSFQAAADQVRLFATGRSIPSAPLALPPVMREPWFWATVGGVAVATTAGVLLATQPRGGRLIGDRLGMFGAGF